ncbi:2-hydroxy-3-keto-5-methylthiopentenyl-1-phosphate phosphatase [Bacillus sp. MUM 13]|uniref:2-hydroxy-3-keto-5-methylthiopentenyl-1- phosphate phosphatase n=1 Tax=Bacillus sp. MUM 13 TaxID=1678001 RepID=UPI0008F59BAE|nr:2-hydroxy-3-keto-5-methylthiopentenyl-1-phosphate phosphatase [Bacillus sp. MUM 13]OIK09506.1 2-hydroxy-3-keto-5-methylthiopentenyl-1-phosphate phosphatase [Bacillus sp. MUM 13]
MKPIIFCDFDGTITNSDNIIAIMKEFAPEGWESIKDDVLSQKVSISEGVGKMFSLLDSGLEQDIIEFVKSSAVIRDGFREFVAFARQNRIPLYVVSGGIDFFIEPLLENILDLDLLYCNKAVFEQENIKIEWPNSCDDQCQNGCGCCKPSIMRKISEADTYKIVIGDSITDFEAAKEADLVLARDFLIEKCREEGISYQPFQTFFDCINILKLKLEAA